MIITLTIVIGTSIGLSTGFIGGGITGYFFGNRRRVNREMCEDYDAIFNYLSINDENDSIQ
jgi:hypothetical protein